MDLQNIESSVDKILILEHMTFTLLDIVSAVHNIHNIQVIKCRF
jgi:hypothetical protein